MQANIRSVVNRLVGPTSLDDSQPQKPHNFRSEAILEAQMIIAYAAETGTNIDTAAVATIAQAQHDEQAATQDKSSWTSASEAEFWDAYKKLAQSIRPVTVSSLRATSAAFGSRSLLSRVLGYRKTISKARLAAINFTTLGIVALVILLVSQAYWTYVSTALTQYDQIVQDVATAKAQVDNLRLPGSKASQDAIANAKAQLDAKNLAFDSAVKTLDTINIGRSRLDPTQPDSELRAKDTLRFSVDIIRKMLSLYILPLLYGYIGAIAYVLRSLSSEIRAFTFTDVSQINYRLRGFLGALSGLVIGLFLTPWGTVGSSSDATAQHAATAVAVGGISIEQISPFALAFVAGFSVELLFSVLERIVKAFTTDDSKNAPAPPH
jgi:hypothetical protein